MLDRPPTPPAARPGTVKPQLAAETLRLYAGDWMHFQAYCAEHGLAALPASPELVAAFLAAPCTGRARPGPAAGRHRPSASPAWPRSAGGRA